MSNDKQVPQPSGETGAWPFLQSFQSEMNRLFDRFNTPAPWNGTQMMPAIDVAETDSAMEISVDVPGVDQNDLDVSVVHESLIIKGTKSSEQEDSDKDWHMVERSYGSFRRVVPLGFMPNEKDVEATYENGVLKLHVMKPVDGTAKTHKVQIKAT